MQQYTYQLFRSITDVDEDEWYSLVNNDLAMNIALIRLMENTLSSQAKFWTAMIYNNQQQPVACACLCLFQSDGIQSSPLWVINLFKSIRKIWPNCLKFKVLFCGLPFPSAETHFKIADNVEAKPIMSLITKIMHELAHQQKASLIVFKELCDNQRSQLTNIFTELNYIQGDIVPTYQLEGSFTGFDDYQNALRSKYRWQMQQNIKKFTTSGLTIRQETDPKIIEQLFTDEVYQLYLNVWEKANEKLECFPKEFFGQLGYAMPNETRLTLIYQEDVVVAFAIGLLHNKCYKNLYCGIDYDVNLKTDCYFNLFYAELGSAFAEGATKIQMGQTSDHFKSRLGAQPHKRYFFVKNSNKLVNNVLKIFRQLIFPAVQEPIKCQVFKN